jgi:hypothetical protein
LNLDLDFFVHGVAHWRAPEDERLDSREFRPWSHDEVLSFLQERCGLRASLPGFVVKHHGELFARWRAAIDAGRLSTPFDLVHVDAHADLGLGDSGYVYLMTDVLFEPPSGRRHPEVGPTRLADGNWLAFAIACRWISTMTYVFNEGGGKDLLHLHMQDFDHAASNIELKAVRPEELKRVMFSPASRPEIDSREPLVPFAQIPWRSFSTNEPFDAICLAQSPPFTPAASDEVFDLIKDQFIDEAPFLAV